jgi:uncharacterized membrane protein
VERTDAPHSSAMPRPLARPSAGRVRNWLLVAGLAAAVGVAVIAYPFAIEELLTRFGARAVAAALLALTLTSLLLPGRGVARMRATGTTPALGFPVLLALAAITRERIYLLLIPSLVYLTLASVFYSSLRGPDSLIEKGARSIAPYIPDFTRPYCRKLTAVWAAFFLASAILIAALAWAELPGWWRAYSGGLIYALMGAIAAVEFLVRKTYFRYYYHGGLFDRVWSRWFPAENTAQGRASLESIRSFREQLATRDAALRAPAQRRGH